MTGSDACLSPSYRFGQGLLVSIAFFVIGVGALFSKLFHGLLNNPD
jgi:hypothetical protein